MAEPLTQERRQEIRERIAGVSHIWEDLGLTGTPTAGEDMLDMLAEIERLEAEVQALRAKG